MQELESLLKIRDEVWNQFVSTPTSLTRALWEDRADVFRKAIRKATTDYWHNFCSSLDSTTDHSHIL